MPCPRCGEPAAGQYCAGCGAALTARPCVSCGQPLTIGARFCHLCGTAAGPGASAAASRGMPPAWVIAASVLVVLAAFVAGQQFAGRSQPAAPADQSTLFSAPFAGGASRVPDISNMSPEEAASRLFDRVMRYASEGKADSAAMFAPMAILAYQRIGAPDAHARYDMGSISAVTGDAASATVQADTILAKQPNHLLGLLLAAKAADLRHDAAAAARFRSRFAAALPAERARALPEYTDHKRDIDEAAANVRPARP